MSAVVETPSARKTVPATFLPWLIAWGIAAVLIGALLAHNAALDTWLWRTTRWAFGSQLENRYDWAQVKAAAATRPDAPWYQTQDPPLGGKLYKRTETLWRVLRALGEPYTMLIIAGVLWLYDRRGWRAAAIMVASTTLAGGLVSLLSATLGRLRPDGKISELVRNNGENLWALGRGFAGGGDLSFPSGHATLAFAIAGVMAYLSPRGRWLFAALAVGCALSRVVLQAHFYADVIAGGLLGYTLGFAFAALFDRTLGTHAEKTEPTQSCRI